MLCFRYCKTQYSLETSILNKDQWRHCTLQFSGIHMYIGTFLNSIPLSFQVATESRRIIECEAFEGTMTGKFLSFFFPVFTIQFSSTPFPFGSHAFWGLKHVVLVLVVTCISCSKFVISLDFILVQIKQTVGLSWNMNGFCHGRIWNLC